MTDNFVKVHPELDMSGTNFYRVNDCWNHSLRSPKYVEIGSHYKKKTACVHKRVKTVLTNKPRLAS